jgi:hypothetical protein
VSSPSAAAAPAAAAAPKKKKQKQKRNGRDADDADNPYLRAFVHQMTVAMPRDTAFITSSSMPSARRVELLNLMDAPGGMNALMTQYGWAIPTATALRVIARCGPRIVEMGAGLGYWGSLLMQQQQQQQQQSKSSSSSVDYTAYDIVGGRRGEPRQYTVNGGSDDDEKAASSSSSSSSSSSAAEATAVPTFFCDVQQGTPQMLSDESFDDAALMLCYPDDFERSGESMALQCLENYAGHTIIHIGELLCTGTKLENPWGKTSSDTFQQQLHASFHMVCSLPLPCFPTSKDVLTVWRRTPYCDPVPMGGDDDDDDDDAEGADGDAEEDDDDDDDAVQFKCVPAEEQMLGVHFAPCFADVLGA